MGGIACAVRDFILQRHRDEIDFLVVGNGLDFASAFAKELNINQVSVYRTFGTAHFKFQDFDFEFVGARKESYIQESRNPSIEIGTFEDDISRRDFTINTLAVSLNKENFGELIDIYNGIKDLENENAALKKRVRELEEELAKK